MEQQKRQATVDKVITTKEVTKNNKAPIKEQKKLEIVNAPNGMLSIQWGGGGQLPVELTGYFTGSREAQQLIDNYMASKA